MNVLSLFDGMSCGLVALRRAGIKVDNYFASEVDKYAIQIAKKNHPEIEHIGDVNHWPMWRLPKIDLMIGGSPCQGFSLSGKQLNFKDPRSKLFFQYINCRDAFGPRWFLLENVRMKKEIVEKISSSMGVDKVLINSAMVSAQNRNRLYWTNAPGPQPLIDKNILLKDVLIDDLLISSEYNINEKWLNRVKTSTDVKKCFTAIDPQKALCMVARQYDNWKGTLITRPGGYLRRLTPVECERLQTLPDNYTEGVSDRQRYKMLGNGWTVDVITHILTQLFDSPIHSHDRIG